MALLILAFSILVDHLRFGSEIVSVSFLQGWQIVDRFIYYKFKFQSHALAMSAVIPFLATETQGVPDFSDTNVLSLLILEFNVFSKLSNRLIL